MRGLLRQVKTELSQIFLKLFTEMRLDDFVRDDSVTPPECGVPQPCPSSSALVLGQLLGGNDDVALILAAKLFRQVILLQILQALN